MNNIQELTPQSIKENLSVEEIEDYVVNALGSNGYKFDADGNPIFQTIDHNPPGTGSYKLYYYTESHCFVSYTGSGEPMDIYELTRQAKEFEGFKEAFRFVCSYFHIGVRRNLLPVESASLSNDWDILNKISDFDTVPQDEDSYEILSPSLLEVYHKAYPLEWVKEGISLEAMRAFNIHTYAAMSKIIIPHYDIDGFLVGIRGRSYDPEELSVGMKYAPVWSENVCYKHELGRHLYGLHLVKDTVSRLGKVCIAEGEKSALLSYTYYGDNSFTVATCGSAPLSSAQINLLLSLGCKEIIFAYDKENDTDETTEKSKKYWEKLVRIATPLTTFFDVNIVYDRMGLLGDKDSPFDRGKETLEKLMKSKIYVPSISSPAKPKRR